MCVYVYVCMNACGCVFERSSRIERGNSHIHSFSHSLTHSFTHPPASLTHSLTHLRFRTEETHVLDVLFRCVLEQTLKEERIPKQTLHRQNEHRIERGVTTKKTQKDRKKE